MKSISGVKEKRSVRGWNKGNRDKKGLDKREASLKIHIVANNLISGKMNLTKKKRIFF